LLGPAPLDSGEQQIEGVQLVIASYKGNWLSAGVGCIGIREGAHETTLQPLLGFI
jgi:hypothetical protein